MIPTIYGGKTKYSSGAPWELIVGYSRAVLVGSNIYISGTTAFDETGNIVGENDAYEQIKQIIKNIEIVLRKITASLSDVVRTRIFVTDILDWRKIGKAHQEAFGDTLPATTMVEVTRLIRPEFQVEIEADAILK
jgi:enamine deaminase RidA (YjgF/YER057c/UK114 family)